MVDEILKKIDQVARMAGLRGQRVGELMMYNFDLGRGREQAVAITHFGETEEGMNIITFISPCQRLSSGFLGGLNKTSAMNFLRYNTQLPFGHFCIMEIGDDEMVCVRATQILETMEVQEFEANCVTVAQVADAWEQRIGKDDF